MTNFKAVELFAAVENDVFIISLSNNTKNPTQYIILQKEVCSDKQSVDLGLNGCYFESSEVEQAGYDLINKCKLDDAKLKLKGNSFKDLTIDISALDKAAVNSLKTHLKELLGEIVDT